MTTTNQSERPLTLELGEAFAEARNAKRLTIERVAQLLRVSPRVLSWLEAGEYAHLPPEPFLRGIIRRYATLVGLEPAAMLEAYRRAAEHHAVRTAGPTDLLPANRFARRRYSLSFGAKECAILLAAAAFLYLAWQVGWLVRPPSIDLEAPAGDTTIVRDSAFVVAGRLKGAERVTINGERIGAAADGRFTHQIALQPGENTIEFRAQNSRGKTVMIVRRIIYQPAP